MIQKFSGTCSTSGRKKRTLSNQGRMLHNKNQKKNSQYSTKFFFKCLSEVQFLNCCQDVRIKSDELKYH